jgi:hypothetical protein
MLPLTCGRKAHWLYRSADCLRKTAKGETGSVEDSAAYLLAT